VHLCASELLGRVLHSNRCLNESGAGKKKTTAFGHQDVITHYRQVGSTGYTHSHNGSDLGNSHGGHDSVVAEDAAKIVCIWENVFLQWKKYTGGVHKINGRNAILDGDVLSTDYFLRRHWKERARFHRCVIRDQHEEPALDSCKSRDHSSCRCSTPLLIHSVGSVDCQLKQLRTAIDEQSNAFTSSEAALAVLGFDCLGSPTLSNLLLFARNGCDQISHRQCVFLKSR